jgi:hypothetical protein
LSTIRLRSCSIRRLVSARNARASASFIDVPLSFCITVAVSMPLTAEWRNQINK